MVDSRKGPTMADPVDNPSEQITIVERKLDTLSTSIDARFDAVDARFDAVDARVDAMSASVDRRFDDVTVAIVEQRQYTEFAIDRLAGEMKAGFGRLERKLDQFIDTQSKTNELVERRLTRIESSSP